MSLRRREQAVMDYQTLEASVQDSRGNSMPGTLDGIRGEFTAVTPLDGTDRSPEVVFAPSDRDYPYMRRVSDEELVSGAVALLSRKRIS